VRLRLRTKKTMLMPDPKSKRRISAVLFWAFAIAVLAIATRKDVHSPARAGASHTPPSPFLGFDRNDYPGDAALPALRRTFAFSSYWLNAPPGEKSNPWVGKRGLLAQNNFGFLVLFTGRGSKQLKHPEQAAALGTSDAAAAAASARREGFPAGTIIFLDIEEGGRMLPAQLSYIYAWVDALSASGFRAGAYCSAMPVNDGGAQVMTAADIRDHAGSRAISFWVYNDACPPAPGCAYPPNPPPPASSGFASASVWQFAQSPRRPEFTARCSTTYSADGNCYPPAASSAGSGSIFLDLDSAWSPDPSSARP
jgi:hypothetical protein